VLLVVLLQGFITMHGFLNVISGFVFWYT